MGTAGSAFGLQVTGLHLGSRYALFGVFSWGMAWHQVLPISEDIAGTSDSNEKAIEARQPTERKET